MKKVICEGTECKENGIHAQDCTPWRGATLSLLWVFSTLKCDNPIKCDKPIKCNKPMILKVLQFVSNLYICYSIIWIDKAENCTFWLL